MVIMMNKKEYLVYPSVKKMAETLNILNNSSIEPLQRIRRALCCGHSKDGVPCNGCFFNRTNHKDGLPCSVTLGLFDIDDFEVIKTNVLKYFRQSGMLFEDIEIKRFGKKGGC